MIPGHCVPITVDVAQLPLKLLSTCQFPIHLVSIISKAAAGKMAGKLLKKIAPQVY